MYISTDSSTVGIDIDTPKTCEIGGTPVVVVVVTSTGRHRLRLWWYWLPARVMVRCRSGGHQSCIVTAVICVR